jgi:hypothetical protein
MRGGLAVPAKFEEYVGILPPELKPIRHVPFPVAREWKSVRITLERTKCLGTCPDYKVEVVGDGSVLYEGRGYVAVIGSHRGSVPLKDVHSLIDKFRQADYFSLRKYYAFGATDGPLYTTSIRIGGQKKKVLDYLGLPAGMPMALSDLEDSIDELADTARWTKGNANTVPTLKVENWNFRSAEAAATLARVVEFGNVDAVRALISAGAPINGFNIEQWSPIKRATARGDAEMLRALTDADANR